MPSNDKVLVTGATGNQGFAVANALLDGGAAVRVLVRKPEHDRAKALAARGAELATGDYDHADSVQRALDGVHSVFGVTTPFAGGVETEVRHGKDLVDAAVAAGVGHFVFSSVGDANKGTGIPHFESKFEVERHLATTQMPHTITAPAYFYENLLFPWNIPDLKQGRFRQAMPADRPLQQVGVRDIGRFNALVLRRPDDFIGKRIDFAGDELTGDQLAATIGKHIGRAVEFVEQPIAEVRSQSEDLALMYEWFDKVGYSSDVEKLRSDYPEVEWLTFDAWAGSQDWKGILG